MGWGGEGRTPAVRLPAHRAKQLRLQLVELVKHVFPAARNLASRRVGRGWCGLIVRLARCLCGRAAGRCKSRCAMCMPSPSSPPPPPPPPRQCRRRLIACPRLPPPPALRQASSSFVKSDLGTCDATTRPPLTVGATTLPASTARFFLSATTGSTHRARANNAEVAGNWSGAREAAAAAATVAAAAAAAGDPTRGLRFDRDFRTPRRGWAGGLQSRVGQAAGVVFCAGWAERFLQAACEGRRHMAGWCWGVVARETRREGGPICRPDSCLKPSVHAADQAFLSGRNCGRAGSSLFDSSTKRIKTPID